MSRGRHTFAWWLGAATAATLASFASLPAHAAGAWASGNGQGYVEYTSKAGTGSIDIGCDFGATLDHSNTRIMVYFGGKQASPNAEITFDVDGQAVSFTLDDYGDVMLADCPQCIADFRTLWSMLRQGNRLTVETTDGHSAVFSLSGTSKTMPPEPCPTTADAD